MSERRISHSETTALLTCQFKWDFSYGHQLAGTSLKAKDTPVMLQDGRAWGAFVGEYNAGTEVDAAVDLMAECLDGDADRLRKFGLFDPEQFAQQLELLREIADHYVSIHEPLGIDRLEHEIVVPIPSRSGLGDSNRYKLQTFFDGIQVDDAGRTWLYEAKLRKQLSSLQMIYLSRQLRWYAWAYRKEFGVEPAGIIVDERKKDVPKPVKLNKDGSPSKVQSCTEADYIAAGGDHEETLEKIRAKKWGLREPVFLTTAEIDEAGQQLVSAGQQIRDFDVAERYPVRNPSPMYCGGCQFKDICRDPSDTELTDALFERTTPKKDKPAPPIREEVAV